MTKEAKSIIKKDIKKYSQLAEYTEGENRDTYQEIALNLQRLIEGKEWVKWHYKILQTQNVKY